MWDLAPVGTTWRGSRGHACGRARRAGSPSTPRQGRAGCVCFNAKPSSSIAILGAGTACSSPHKRVFLLSSLLPEPQRMSGERAEAASLGSRPHHPARWLPEPPGTATSVAPLDPGGKARLLFQTGAGGEWGTRGKMSSFQPQREKREKASGLGGGARAAASALQSRSDPRGTE